MRLTKQTSYAIRILLLCARSGEALVKVADIARELDLTPQNTFKSVHILAKAGFVAPVRGRNGGVRLARPAEEIRVSEVVQAVEFSVGDIGSEDVAADGRTDSGAPIGKVLDAAFAAFLSVLEGHTLAELAKSSVTPPQPKSKPVRKAARAISRPAARA